MKLINSISGGKTSSFMAYHYPADHEIFALVRIDDRRCAPKDKSLVKRVSDKIGMDFIATAESDKTLMVVLDIEQLIGREVIWVTGDTFEQVCLKRKALPNIMWRFCTSEMKMKPIFDYCQSHFGMVRMNIGFRFDEDRSPASTTFKTIVGKTTDGRNRWAEISWRTCEYPLRTTRVDHWEVYQWSLTTGLNFPPDSNCVGCFHKDPQQLRKNWDDETKKMQWFADLEAKMRRKFKKEMSYEQIKKIGLQSEFHFGTGTGCKAGVCHD